MRLHKKQLNKCGRRLIVLLVLCGLLLPVREWAEAVSVTYRYDWITDQSGLPTDNQWHDYFIAWEDSKKPGEYWFTDYNWFTLDGDSNVDVGGISWMEYKSQSKLQDTTSKSFTSTQCMGHMQIKFVGYDKDNGNSPKYHIRFVEKTGKYKYVDRWNPSTDPDSADAFTFLDKGDVFHIFVNISNQADVYLTRDGDQLETSLSSSSSEKEYPMRVYKRSIDKNAYEDQNMSLPAESKITMYKYTRIDDVNELLQLCKDATNKWTDILLAWENYTGGEDHNSKKVWYTKGVWYDEDCVNYINDDSLVDTLDNYYYYSETLLGNDRYTSAFGDSFTTKEPVSHFQIWHSGEKDEQFDGDNQHDGYESENGKKDCPKVQLRFVGEGGKYFYLTPSLLKTSPHSTGATVQMLMDEDRREDSDYSYGSCRIFWNRSYLDDVRLTRWGNRIDISYDNHSDWGEYPFRIYRCDEVEYDAIVRDFTVGNGSSYTVDSKVLLMDDVTITVEDGGVLSIDTQLYNNGHIHIKDGGTVILNEGSYVMPFDASGEGGKVTVDGGSLIIMDGAKLLCDEGYASLKLSQGATVVNRGFLAVSKGIYMEDSSILQSEKNGYLVLGCCMFSGRGGIGEMTFNEVKDNMVMNSRFLGYMEGDSKLLYYQNTMSISSAGASWLPSDKRIVLTD